MKMIGGHLDRLLRFEYSTPVHKKAGKSSYIFLKGLPHCIIFNKGTEMTEKVRYHSTSQPKNETSFHSAAAQ